MPTGTFAGPGNTRQIRGNAQLRQKSLATASMDLRRRSVITSHQNDAVKDRASENRLFHPTGLRQDLFVGPNCLHLRESGLWLFPSLRTGMAEPEAANAWSVQSCNKPWKPQVFAFVATSWFLSIYWSTEHTFLVSIAFMLRSALRILHLEPS